MSKPSQPTRPPIQTGDVLADRYEVIDVLGEGGMGIVYECQHLKLGTRVAVKMLLDDAAEEEEVRLRFDREARAAAQLKSPHVARVLDVDETADGRPFMVMEFLEGYGLDEVVESVDQVDVVEAVDYLLQACSGMAEAHGLEIVHRDLKPPNLFCAINDGDARVKVLDFGISKVLLPGEERGVTHTTTTFGTPTYMSPEQIQSAKNVDARADIWSLGVILYELLVGFPPFDGDNPGAIIWSICSTNPTPPVEFRDDIPKGLSDVIMVALEKDRIDRFQTVVDFAEALEEYGTDGVWQPPPDSSRIIRTSRPSGRGLRSAMASAQTQRKAPPHKIITHAPWTTPRRLAVRRTNRALIVGVVATVALVVGGIGLLVTGGGADPAAQPSLPDGVVEPASPEVMPTPSPVAPVEPQRAEPPEVAATADVPDASAPEPTPASAPEPRVRPSRPKVPAPPPIAPPPPPARPKPQPPAKPSGRDPIVL